MSRLQGKRLFRSPREPGSLRPPQRDGGRASRIAGVTTARKTRLTALFSVGALTLAMWSVPATAHADPASTVVRCGQTLTSSTRLANNLVGCSGDGLVIGADNITVDLAGHSITGRNAPGSEGIADDGHAGVRVQNGSIQNFFLNGVGLRGAPGSTVRKMTIRAIGAGGGEGDTSAGVLIKNSPHTVVTGSTLMNAVTAYQSDGVDVLSSAGTTVSGNRLADNAWDGMFVLSSPHTRVVGNVIDGNQNQGVEVNSGSDSTRVARNSASNNARSGIVVGAVSDAQIEGNTVTGNGDSGLFSFDLLNSRIQDNRAHGNGVGIDLEGGQNVSTGNRIVKNDTSNNAHTGLVLGSGANENDVARNVSNANQGLPGDGGGIILFAASRNTVFGNTADRNLDVGIGVIEDQPGDASGNILRANTANANHNHGIDAVDGTVDAGRNTAHGNTPLPNCLGVSCG